MRTGKTHSRLLWALAATLLVACASVGLLWGAPRAKAKAPAKAPKKATAAPAQPAAPEVAPARPAAESTGGVEILSPKTDAKVRGVVTVRASWPQPGGYVLFRADDKFLYSTASPFIMRWDTSGMEDGPHVLSIDAFNSRAQFQGSSSIRIEVKNTVEAPSGGVLLAVRFGEEDVLDRTVNARGELATPGTNEVLPAGYDVLAATMRADLSQTVMDPFYQGTSVLLRNRVKDGWLTVGATRSSLPEIGQYAMVQVSRNGLTVPRVTAVRTTRIPVGEISLALPDYPVLVGDTWQSPIGVLPDLFSKRTVYTQGQHTFEGLRWYSDQECAVITSTYSIPQLMLFGAPATAAAAPDYTVSLTQGMMGDEGMGMGRRMRAGNMGGPGAARRPGAAAQPGAARQPGAPQGLQSARLVELQGNRVTYLARHSGYIIHTEDKILGRVEFKAAGATAAAPSYTLSLAQGMMGEGGMGRGRMRSGEMGGPGAGRQAGAARQPGAARAPAAAAATKLPASLDYGLRLTTDYVPRQKR